MVKIKRKRNRKVKVKRARKPKRILKVKRGRKISTRVRVRRAVKSGRRIARIIRSTRKKRTRVKVKRARKVERARRQPPKKPTSKNPQDWLVTSSSQSAKKSFDFIAVAFTGREAIGFVKAYLIRELGRANQRNLQGKGWRWTALQFQPPQYEDIDQLGDVEER